MLKWELTFDELCQMCLRPGVGVYAYCLYRHFWYFSFPGTELSYPLTLETKLRVTKVLKIHDCRGNAAGIPFAHDLTLVVCIV